MVVVTPEVSSVSKRSVVYEAVRLRVVENRGERGVGVPKPCLNLCPNNIKPIGH